MRTENVNRRNFFSRTFAAIAALWCGSKVQAEGIPQNGAEYPESPFDWREEVGRSGPCRWCGEAARIRRRDVREIESKEDWKCYEPDGEAYWICSACAFSTESQGSSRTYKCRTCGAGTYCIVEPRNGPVYHECYRCGFASGALDADDMRHCQEMEEWNDAGGLDA